MFIYLYDPCRCQPQKKHSSAYTAPSRKCPYPQSHPLVCLRMYLCSLHSILSHQIFDFLKDCPKDRLSEQTVQKIIASRRHLFCRKQKQ